MESKQGQCLKMALAQGAPTVARDAQCQPWPWQTQIPSQGHCHSLLQRGFTLSITFFPFLAKAQLPSSSNETFEEYFIFTVPQSDFYPESDLAVSTQRCCESWVSKGIAATSHYLSLCRESHTHVSHTRTGVTLKPRWLYCWGVVYKVDKGSCSGFLKAACLL